MAKKKRKTSFDIALSFAGEDREYVEEVAQYLIKMGYSVFYDKYEKVTLWGKDLFEHLSKIYYELSSYTLIFISKYYAKKLWTNHERKNAQARAFESNQEYVLPVRFDNTKIAGILPTTGYLDLSEISPRELADLIKQKVGQKLQYDFVPEELDILNKMLSANKKKEKIEIKYLADLFIDSMKLMTKNEREILFKTVCNSCPSDPPEDIHINLELLSRIVGISKNDIISLFARLECFQINSNVSITNNKCNGAAHISKSKEIISIKYEPMTTVYSGNATQIVYGIFNCFDANMCPDCCLAALERLDFSILSSLSGFPEKEN